MIRDLFIGVGLIVYAFSGMWCYLLLSAAIINALITCEPDATDNLPLNLHYRITICLFSMIPIWNTIMAIVIDKNYEDFIDETVKKVEARLGKHVSEDRNNTDLTEASTADSN